jgi:xylose dehydrogenase (NAD/NADP)
VTDRIRFGVLGAAGIARALLPAMQAAHNAVPVSIASRDPERAAELAREHEVARTHPTYDALLDDPGIDAVYVALHNSAHREWVERALDAGKHVLCEKPLGMNVAEVEAMQGAVERSGRSLMEAFMYRFHPRMQRLRATVGTPRHLRAEFGFPLAPAPNYRWDPRLGGGALLDVGCYVLDVLRWFAGEPDTVSAAMHVRDIDLSVVAMIGFAGDVTGTAWASFESAEQQSLLITTDDEVHTVEQPFTAWRDPHDPYQLMVEAFSQSLLDGAPPPRSLDDSLGTARLSDAVRAAALSEAAEPSPTTAAAAPR